MPSVRAMEIIRLHEEIEAALKMTVPKATRVGELLEQEKAAKPRQFEAWVRENLPFSVATARNYRMLYTRRAEVESLTVSDLGEIYRALRRRPKARPSNNQIMLRLSDDEAKRFTELATELAEKIFQTTLQAAVLKAMEFAVEHRGAL